MNESNETLRAWLCNSMIDGGPDKPHIKARLCAPDGEWFTVIFDRDLAFKFSIELSALAGEL